MRRCPMPMADARTLRDGEEAAVEGGGLQGGGHAGGGADTDPEGVLAVEPHGARRVPARLCRRRTRPEGGGPMLRGGRGEALHK